MGKPSAKTKVWKAFAWVRISWLCWRAESLSLTTRSGGCFGQSEGQKRAGAIYLIPATALISASGAKQCSGHLRHARVVLPAPPTNERTDGLSEFNLFSLCILSRSTGHEYSMRNGLFTGTPRHQGRARRSQRHLNWTLNYYELRSAACGVRAAQFAGAQRLIWQKCSIQRSLGQFSLGRR